MKQLLLLFACALVLGPTDAHAQSSGDVARLFSHQAPVTQSGGSVYRLPLTTEVLAICRPDLADVRLYDFYGTEIPWMLDSATRVVTPDAQQLAETAAPILATPTHTVEHSPTIPFDFHEVYEIAAPGEPPSRGEWDLVLSTTRDHFVTDVHVSTTDGTSEREIGHGSVYRFQSPLRELLRIPVTDAGFDRVRVEIRGHEGYLEPVMTWVASRRARVGEALVVPLQIVSSTHDGHQTVLTLARPDGVFAEMLRFTTTSPAFSRSVHVTTSNLSIDATIWRVPGDAGVSSLDVRAPAAQEPTIVVRIDDQDSPPLTELTVAAVLARPVLVYFSDAAMLRFGGARVRAPHYDLASLQGSWAVDQLLDGTTMPVDATLGPISESPGWTNAPALAFLHRPGAAVAPDAHRYTAPLEVRAATEGASRFVLDANVLAALREDLADLRIVDAQGQQWPYLVRDTEALMLPVTLGAPTHAASESRYEIGLPATVVSAIAIRLDPDAALVSRPLRVVGTDTRGDEQTLAVGSLARYVNVDEGPISTPLYTTRVSTIALYVSDGSETPLAFRSAQLALPTHEIVLVAPAGSYRLLAGQDDAESPTYDIGSAGTLLEAIPLDDATLGALVPNPAHHEPTFWERTGSSTLALWLVLVLAIVVLGGLTWRASRSPEEPAPVPAAPAQQEKPKSDEPPA